MRDRSPTRTTRSTRSKTAASRSLLREISKWRYYAQQLSLSCFGFSHCLFRVARPAPKADNCQKEREIETDRERQHAALQKNASDICVESATKNARCQFT